MTDKPVEMTFRMGYTPSVDQDYAKQHERRNEEAWQRLLMQEKADLEPAAPTTAAKPEAGAEKPSAIKVGVEAGAMAAADAGRNMVDGLRALFGAAPSAGVAKAFNVPAKGDGEGAQNPIEGAKQIVMSGLLQFGFSPLSGTFAGARQALENSAPDVANTPLASGFAAAGIRGVLEGKSYASLKPDEQKRFLGPLTVGEVIETIGPMIVPAVAGPVARGAKKAGQAIKEQAPNLMSERGAFGFESKPARMQASAINKELDALEKKSSAVTDKLIAEGRGSEKPSETRTKTDPLSVEWQTIADRQSLLRSEIAARYGPSAPARLPSKGGFGPRERGPAAEAFSSERGSIGPPPEPAAFEGTPQGGGATPKPSAEGVKPPETPPTTPAVEPLPGGPPGTHVNLNRIGASDAVKAVIADLNRAQAEALKGHRAPKGHAQTVAGSKGALSLEKALALDPETAVLTAEEGTAVRDLYNRAATHLEDLQTRADKGDQKAMNQAYAAAAVAGRLALIDEAIGRNIARSLEARSIESQARRAKYDPHELGVLAQALETASEVDGAVFLKRLAELKTERQKRSFLGQMVQATRLGIHAGHTIWTHNLLTNPVTHTANIGGTTLTTLAEIPERLGAEILHQIFSSNPNGVQRGETWAALRGLAEGVFTDGIRFAGKAAKGEDPFGGKGSVERGPRIRAEEYGWDPETPHGKFVDVMGATLDNLPAFWALRVEDAYFKGLNYRMEVNALSVREARAEGLKGKAYENRVAELEANPPPSMMLAAQDAALLRTLNAELGPVGQAFATAVNEVPGGRVIVPFVRTPINSTKWWGQRAPILNLISVQNWRDIQAGGAAREKAVARQILGSAVGAAIAWRVFNGDITGAGPTDRNLKRDQRAMGLEPFTLRVGDQTYTYSRLEPVGAYIGLVATATELMSQVPFDEWPEHMTDALIIAGGETMANKTSLMGLSNVLEAIKNPDRKAHAFAKGLARSVVPAGIRQAERVRSDGVIRDSQTLMDAVRSGIPGYSDDIPAILNPITGEPIRFPPGWGPDMISPVLISKLVNDPVLAEIVTHHVSIPNVPTTMKGAPPPKGPSIEPERANRGVKLTGMERYRWSELMSRIETDGEGRTLYQRLLDLVKSEGYARMSDGPDGTKADMIKDVYRTYRERAEGRHREENPELDRDIRALQRRRIQLKLPKDSEEAISEPAQQTPAMQRLLQQPQQSIPATLGR